MQIDYSWLFKRLLVGMSPGTKLTQLVNSGYDKIRPAKKLAGAYQYPVFSPGRWIRWRTGPVDPGTSLVARVFAMLKFMTNHSYYPYLVVNVVFSTAPSAILIYQYPEYKYKVKNIFSLANLSIKSFIIRIRYLSFLITAFNSL